MVGDNEHKLVMFLLIVVVCGLTFSLSFTYNTSLIGHAILSEQFIEGEIEGFFLAGTEKVDVIIALEYDIDEQSDKNDLSNHISKKVDQALEQFNDGEFTLTEKYKYAYAVAGKITEEGLETIKDNKSAFAAVYLDRIYRTQTFNPQQGIKEYVNLPTSNEIKLSSGELDGSGVSVCLLDTGIADVNNRIKEVSTQECICDDCCNTIADENGHGTSMASLLVGELNSSSEGVDGIAKGINLYSVKVCNKDGRCNLRDVFKGIEYCIEEGTDIIVGGMGDEQKRYRHCPIILDSIFKNFNHITPIFPAGNDFFKPGANYPGCSPEVIGVGSLDETQNRNALFSNEDASIDIHAPGTDVLATKLNDIHEEQSGTSLSATIVAGAVALIKQVLNDQDQQMTTEEILELLDITASTTEDNYKKLNIKEALKRIGAGYSKAGVTYEREDIGKIEFKQTIDLTGIETCVTIEENLVDFDLSKCPHLDQPATITIYHDQGPDSWRVLRNGHACDLFCKNLRNKPTESTFDVFSMGRFTLQAIHANQDDPDDPEDEVTAEDLGGEEILNIQRERDPRHRIPVTFKNTPKLGEQNSTNYILLSFLAISIILIICVLSFRTYYRPTAIDTQGKDSRKLAREMDKHEPDFKWRNPYLRKNIPAKLKRPDHKGIKIIRGEKRSKKRK